MGPRRAVLALAAGLTALLTCAAPQAQEAAAPFYALSPPAAGGVEAADRALARLGAHRRLLVIGAHPDDEDTEILAFVARGLGGEAAYLSLTRGEGGQNLVGPDLGVGLGLVRSRELGAARRLDGARQYFTRAYDFGFTRSLDEALSNWPREALFGDAVRVIRRFRPQVVVTIFTGTARDGHGQHQAAGVTAREAFRLAGDPAAFGELAGEGLTPWKPVSLLQETGYWRDQAATTVVLPTGQVEPLTGWSVYQIAMASRSLHRSQDMGQLQEPGPNQTMVGWVAGGAGRDGHDLFSGVDTRLRAMAAEVPDGPRRAQVEKLLDAVEVGVADARRRLSTPDLSSMVPALARVAGGPARGARARPRRRRRHGHAPRRKARTRPERARGGRGGHARRGRGPRNGGAGRVVRGHGVGVERGPRRRRRRERRPGVAGPMDHPAGGRRRSGSGSGKAGGVERAGDGARNRGPDRSLFPGAPDDWRPVRLERRARGGAGRPVPAGAGPGGRPTDDRGPERRPRAGRLVSPARPGDRRGPASDPRRPGARGVRRTRTCSSGLSGRNPSGSRSRSCPTPPAPFRAVSKSSRRRGGRSRTRGPSCSPNRATVSSSTSTSRHRPCSRPADWRSASSPASKTEPRNDSASA